MLVVTLDLPIPRAGAYNARMNDLPPRRRFTVGCVSFLNSRPLIEGIDQRADVDVHFAVPSALLDGLIADETDVALCPVMDYQASPEPLTIVPVGGIGCDGPTLTVRLFSRRPMCELDEVYVDTDSHTSVQLLRVILARRFGCRPTLRPFDAEEGEADRDAMLLIGDKVVTHRPDGEDYPHQLDLGEAWKAMTGLPFVFAVWMAKRDTDLGDLPHVLDRQRQTNAQCIDEIVARHAGACGWPADLARRYLGELLRYAVGERELAAMRQFWNDVAELGAIRDVRPMQVYGAAPA